MWSQGEETESLLILRPEILGMRAFRKSEQIATLHEASIGMKPLPDMSHCCAWQYADRLPIGLESVIQNVPADVVRAFYERWYRPENMAVVAAGDFDVDAVLAMITAKLGNCYSRDASPPTSIPRCCSASWAC